MPNQFTVVVGGMPVLASALNQTGMFARVVPVASTGELRALLATPGERSLEDKIFIFADNMTVDTQLSLGSLLSRITARGVRVIVVALTPGGHALVQECPGAGLVSGEELWVNTVLGAIAGLNVPGISPVAGVSNIRISAPADPVGGFPVLGQNRPAEREYAPQAAEPAYPARREQTQPDPFAAPAAGPFSAPTAPFATPVETFAPPAAFQPPANPFAAQEERRAPAFGSEGGDPFAAPTRTPGPSAPTPFTTPPFGSEPETQGGPFGSGPFGQPGATGYDTPAPPRARTTLAEIEKSAAYAPSGYPAQTGAYPVQGGGYPAQADPYGQPGYAPASPFGEEPGYGGNFGAPVQAPVRRRGFVITVTAPKGGTGKSSLSLNLAAYLGLRLRGTGRNVCLIDANVQQADAGKYLNAYTPNVEDVLRDKSALSPENITKYMLHKPGLNMSALLGPATPETANPTHFSGRAYTQILEAIKPNYDYIIIDTPVAEFYEGIFQQFAIPCADFILVAVTPNQTTLINADMWLRQITAPKSAHGMGVDPARIGIALNRAEEGIGCSEDEVRQNLSEWRYLGAIPETKEWKLANNLGEVVATKNYAELNYAFSLVLSQVTNEVGLMDGVELTGDTGSGGGVFKNLFRKKKKN